MGHFDNVMQVFTLLDKSNCRKCGEKTCLAFASAVFRGDRPLSDCPTVDSEVLSRYAEPAVNRLEEGGEDQLKKLQDALVDLDFKAAGERTGGRFDGKRLCLKILGKDFAVDRQGKFYSDIHVTPWVSIPFLTYLLNCRGEEVRGNWISLRESDGGRERYPLFKKRCEEGMKRIADVYTDLFDDMVHLFGGHQVASVFDSDISVVLPVFPKVPLLVCYWGVDEGMASSLNIFFDSTLDANLGGAAAFSIGAGLTQMFEKFALQHGVTVSRQEP